MNSENINTESAAASNEDATRRVEIYVKSDIANEILRSFEVPMPDASDLDEIRLIVQD